MKRNTITIAVLGGLTGMPMISLAIQMMANDVHLYPYYTSKDAIENEANSTDSWVLPSVPEAGGLSLEDYSLPTVYELRPPPDMVVDTTPEHGRGKKRQRNRYSQDRHHVCKPANGFSFKGNNRRQLMQRVGHL